jgi:hypothetical protein
MGFRWEGSLQVAMAAHPVAAAAALVLSSSSSMSSRSL